MTDKLDSIESKIKKIPDFTDEERQILSELITLWRGIKSMGTVGKWLSAVATVCAALFIAVQTFIKGA